MSKDKLDKSKTSSSNLVTPSSYPIPPVPAVSPLSKNETESGTDVNIKSDKNSDRDPTM